MQNQQKPTLATTIFGCVAGLFIALGNFCKFMHWPGAGAMMILGYGVFGLFYLPMWVINEPKKGRKLTLTFQFLLLFLTCLACLFKIQHWPGGGILFNIWLAILLYIVLPVSLIQLFRNGSKTLQEFHSSLVFILLIVLLIAGIGGGSSGMRSIANSFSKNTSQLITSFDKLKVKNKQLYSAFDEIPNKATNPNYIKALKVKALTDSTDQYINHFLNHLIALNENISEANADSLPINQLKEATNAGISTGEICGWDEYKPRTGANSGMELKNHIETFRDSILNYVSADNKNFIKAGMNLDTDPSLLEDGSQEDWVFATFRMAPLSAVLLTLESIRYEIKSTETLVVSDLLNSSKQSFDNLAVKMADLGSKLEDEKKQREIEKLKSDREVSKLNMDLKNQELDEQQQTIIWFIVGLLACSILIFFTIRSNMLRKKTNIELQSQKQIIETKNKEITDSINYAKRIQQAILPPTDIIHAAFKDSFVLYQPKDVVSGDFYGFFKKEDHIIIAAADCTGHGVPGAFMSMIGNEQLSKIIIEKGITKPSDILNELHSGVRKALKQDNVSGESRDGMDIALCKIYLNEKKLEYAGANRPLWIIRNKELIETKADKQPIGGLETDNRKPFTNHEIKLEENDCIYLFTDGYADQFGGDKGKKLMVKNFERHLIELHSESMEKQQALIYEKFSGWKGDHEQVDDVLVIGIKV
jgi:serine phosphatase RsbU (regulator of sigma subunit)